MDQKTDDMAKQNVLDLKCKKILPISEKSSALSSSLVKKYEEAKIVCETPEKISEPLQKKSQEGQVKLPEKYRAIAESFDCMHCSLRLLGLRKKSPTFENVSAQMGVLAKRNFLYKHLAQMKYVLPEALQIDKIIIHDKKTLSMKPDMKISLLFDVVEGHTEVSAFVALSKVFSLRLYSFFSKHPEACDVPEAILPEPFNKRSLVTVPDELGVDSHVNPHSSSTETECVAETVSPISRFRRHFSQNASSAGNETIRVLVSTIIPPVDNFKQDTKDEQQEEFCDQITASQSCLDTKSKLPLNSPDSCSESTAATPQLEPKNSQRSYGSGTAESPLVKPAPIDDSFTIQTPLPSIPRRVVSSCDNNQKMMSGQSLTLSCKPAKRVLDFFQSEGDENASSLSSHMPKCDQVLCQDISQITKGISEEKNISGSSALPKEDMSSCLVDNVALIHSIFKSINFSPITKEELVHKIIMNSLDVVEKREVDELLDLLETRVPDWINRKLVSSGDTIYNIKDASNLDSVRARLTSF